MRSLTSHQERVDKFFFSLLYRKTNRLRRTPFKPGTGVTNEV